MRIPAIFKRETLLYSSIAIPVFYPLLVILLLGILVIPSSKDYFNEALSFSLLSIICYCLIVVFPKSRLKMLIFLAAVFGLSLFAFIKLSFYLHYGVKISASALFVIFETNGSEASDFLTNYLNIKVVGIFVLLFLPFAYYTRIVFFRRKNIDGVHQTLLSPPKNILVRGLLLLFIPLSIYAIQKNYRTNNLIITALGSYKDYLDTKENLKANLAQKTSNYLEQVSASEEPQTYVVVIGESTSSWHMQLYGYPRETNPLLSEIKDELIVFDSVIAPHVHTILSLEKVLTLSNFEDPDKSENGSVVQLSNEAGFETYWISNQKPVGLHESVSTIIGSASDHKYFMATDDYQAFIYDENILPTLDLALRDTSKKKLIFIHLIGTHVAYKKRYPESFSYFENKELLKTSSKEATMLINEYDNAVRYNDSIVRSIVEKVRLEQTNSFVLYFSDHGDDVFDVMDYAGHNEYHATRPMYEIPFVLWLSEDYKKQRPSFLPSETLSSRRYSLEDFMHSFADLSDIRFNSFDAARSIFNENFTVRTRIIKDSINYDQRD